MGKYKNWFTRYRKNGIHQLSEAEQYEAQRVRRNKLVNHSRPDGSNHSRPVRSNTERYYGRWSDILSDSLKHTRVIV